MNQSEEGWVLSDYVTLDTNLCWYGCFFFFFFPLFLSLFLAAFLFFFTQCFFLSFCSYAFFNFFFTQWFFLFPSSFVFSLLSTCSFFLFIHLFPAVSNFPLHLQLLLLPWPIFVSYFLIPFSQSFPLLHLPPFNMCMPVILIIDSLQKELNAQIMFKFFV